MKTLYDLLGVSRQASLQELELAYRHQLELHMRAARSPLGRLGQRRLRVLREAFLLLAAPGRRASYDQQLALQLQRRARRLRHGATLAFACLVVIGFALIGGAWYQQADARTLAAAASATSSATASITSAGTHARSARQSASH
jgi:curved DNA-binding protein CbpA